ncbi:hypothetical protein [Acerihabitans arboris]|uniref:Uncharacterized protein n=1 Tax=Acerihabitans arboris TaxID=2691583 RepID=A0A845SPT2_9GAMM|nr:hypothetical protein [Acerihabitans arboris]NDL65362.1 hypothetical protein [Acerihabitans arboris]
MAGLTNNKPVACHGEPGWPITPMVKNDPWLAGRLLALADAGFVQHEEQGDGGMGWWLTPTGTMVPWSHWDGCYGRMLISPLAP